MSDDMTCPSCGEGRPPRLRTELSKTSRRTFIDGLHPLATSEDWLEVQIRSGKDIDWACDTCLTSKRAIRLDGELTRGGRPAIATLERRKRCADCNAAFTVTAQEIVAGMRATFDPLFDQYRCSPCRRSSAVRDRASQAIHKIMDDPARRDCADYIELARAYGSAGSFELARERLGTARKKASSKADTRKIAKLAAKLDKDEARS